MTKQELLALNLPDEPGVYFWKDAEGDILYIGKATSLRDRTRSYFAPDLKDTRGLRVVTMVTIAHTVTFMETASVLEALMLESRLIKKHKPPYNVREKDDKSYACIVVTKEEFPRVLAMRIRDFEKSWKKKDVLHVWGPFTSMKQVKEALAIVRRMFPFRDTCEVDQGKVCFNAQIGLCPGMCMGLVSSERYRETIHHLRKLFDGKRTALIKDLTHDMHEAARNQQFEEAAKIRNTLFALDHIKDASLIVDDRLYEFKNTDFRIEGYDAAHMGGDDRVGVMTVVEGGEPAKGEYRKFKLPEGINDDYEGLRELLRRRFSHPEWRAPDLIVIDGGKAHKETADKEIARMGLVIPTVAVVKDERHKPKDILGDPVYTGPHKEHILRVNAEAHRFAITYHTKLRNKIV